MMGLDYTFHLMAIVSVFCHQLNLPSAKIINVFCHQFLPIHKAHPMTVGLTVPVVLLTKVPQVPAAHLQIICGTSGYDVG